MFVPCFRLKALHKAMIAHGHKDKMELQPNYGAIVKLAAT